MEPKLEETKHREISQPVEEKAKKPIKKPAVVKRRTAKAEAKANLDEVKEHNAKHNEYLTKAKDLVKKEKLDAAIASYKTSKTMIKKLTNPANRTRINTYEWIEGVLKIHNMQFVASKCTPLKAITSRDSEVIFQCLECKLVMLNCANDIEDKLVRIYKTKALPNNITNPKLVTICNLCNNDNTNIAIFASHVINLTIGEVLEATELDEIRKHMCCKTQNDLVKRSNINKGIILSKTGIPELIPVSTNNQIIIGAEEKDEGKYDCSDQYRATNENQVLPGKNTERLNKIYAKLAKLALPIKVVIMDKRGYKNMDQLHWWKCTEDSEICSHAADDRYFKAYARNLIRGHERHNCNNINSPGGHNSNQDSRQTTQLGLEKLKERIKSIEEKHGGKCLSEVTGRYTTHSKLSWLCGYCNRKWEASLNNIFNHNSWCPDCGNHSLFEKKVRAVFCELFGFEFNSERPIYGNKGAFLELDGYEAELKLAFEANGIQHYKYVPYFHETPIAFNEQQERDKKKLIWCEKKGIALIVIPYTIAHDATALKRFIFDNEHVQRILKEQNHAIPPIKWFNEQINYKLDKKIYNNEIEEYFRENCQHYTLKEKQTVDAYECKFKVICNSTKHSQPFEFETSMTGLGINRRDGIREPCEKCRSNSMSLEQYLEQTGWGLTLANPIESLKSTQKIQLICDKHPMETIIKTPTQLGYGVNGGKYRKPTKTPCGGCFDMQKIISKIEASNIDDEEDSNGKQKN